MVVDWENPQAIKDAAKLKAADLLKFYKGDQPGQIPGILPGPPPNGDYYWWQGGALWGTMIDYWLYTGDTTYNKIVEQAMLFQTGPPDNSYMPTNWTASLGNDDQAFWGMSAMLAAETNFPNPPPDKPQWLALVQAVFNTQAAPDRHDKVCGGGMRWQIPWFNKGYDYKNTIANGCFFNLAARLARYTGNDTYVKHAEETWDWLHNTVKYIDNDWNVYDGAHDYNNCTVINKQQFSYNAAVLLQGAAFLHNYTGNPIWLPRVRGLLNGTLNVFFPEGIAKEISCESTEVPTCTEDMLTYKGYTHRWLATVAQLVPETRNTIHEVLKTSATAATKQCTGGASGRVCGFRWVQGVYDGKTGASEEMSVLGAMLSMLMDSAAPPLTNRTGGTSQGDPGAGRSETTFRVNDPPITPADRAGAGIITTLFVVIVAGIVAWISTDFWEDG